MQRTALITGGSRGLGRAVAELLFPGKDISDRPLPEVTLLFWAWLFGRPPAVTGHRYRAQGDRWEVNAVLVEEEDAV